MASFHMLSLVILAISLVVMGSWVSDRIESSVVDRIGHATALFVDSFIAPVILSTDATSSIEGGAAREFDRLLSETSLGAEILALKIWNREGVIIYSSDETEIGSVYPLEAGLARAWIGEVSAEISDLERPEHSSQRQISDNLLEIYSPVWEHGTGSIAAVVEFYQTVEDIDLEIARARRSSWFVVVGVMLFIYSALAVLFARGNHTITRQRSALETQVKELNDLVDKNVKLNHRARAAAARGTALNERYLRRIAADLHDGPAQDIGYSLLTLDRETEKDVPRDDISVPLKRALKDIRSISSGLQTPELGGLAIAEVVKRAVRIHSTRANARVDLTIEDPPHTAPLSAKIALYRVLQEALSNAHRHAGDAKPRVVVKTENGMIRAEIVDRGTEIRNESLPTHGTQLGLQIMQERIEMLGGRFSVEEVDPAGTVVRAEIPLT